MTCKQSPSHCAGAVLSLILDMTLPGMVTTASPMITIDELYHVFADDSFITDKVNHVHEYVISWALGSTTKVLFVADGPTDESFYAEISQRVLGQVLKEEVYPIQSYPDGMVIVATSVDDVHYFHPCDGGEAMAWKFIADLM